MVEPGKEAFKEKSWCIVMNRLKIGVDTRNATLNSTQR